MTSIAAESVGTVPDTARQDEWSAWAWSLAGGIGLLLAAGGLVDLLLPWFPAHWATPDWRFGAVAESAATLPLPTLGVAALVGAALARGRKGMLRAIGLPLLLVALLLLAGLVVFVLDARSLLAGRGQDPIAVLSLQRLVARTAVTLGLLGPGLLGAAAAALRAGFARRSAKG